MENGWSRVKDVVTNGTRATKLETIGTEPSRAGMVGVGMEAGTDVWDMLTDPDMEDKGAENRWGVEACSGSQLGFYD